MIKRNWPCDVSEIFWDTLMSWDLDFMTKNKIESECDCERKAVCKQLIDLLQHKHYNEFMSIKNEVWWK